MSTAKLDNYGGNTEKKFNPTGFFRTERASDRWGLVDPDGAAFISVGLNHADETNLKYPHNWDVWRKKYGSRESWIKDGVVKDGGGPDDTWIAEAYSSAFSQAPISFAATLACGSSLPMVKKPWN